MFVILFRTVILYFVVVFGLRVMGKRQLGELRPSELVVTILVSNIAALPIEDTNIPMLSCIIAVLSLVCTEVVLTQIALKSPKVRKILYGNQKVIIKDGRVDQKELNNLRYSVDDLVMQLRAQNVFDISEVSYAVIETNGNLSIYKRFNAREATAGMLQLDAQGDDGSPPVVVIENGVLMPKALQFCNLKQEWLDDILRQEGHDIKDVFLMTCNRRAQYRLIPEEKKLS